ncbi:MAG: hypothetical protein U1E43_04530 [Rhodospirillales bacterium]
MQHDDQRRARRQLVGNVGEHAQVAGVAAEFGDLGEVAALARIDALDDVFGDGSGGEKFLPRAAVAALAGELRQVGDFLAKVEHQGCPFIWRGGGERADLDQLAGRRECRVEQAGIGRTARARVEPDGQSPRRRFVAAVDQGAAAFCRRGNELHCGGGKAAADPDAEQLARQRRAQVAGSRAARSAAPAPRRSAGGPAAAQTDRPPRRRRAAAVVRDDHARGFQRSRPPWLQRPVAVDGIGRVHLLRRRHPRSADQRRSRRWPPARQDRAGPEAAGRR